MPTIDVSSDYLAFDNTQTVVLTNPNGQIHIATHALSQGIDTVMADLGDGTLGYRTFSVWHVWRKDLNNSNPIFIPQINCKLTDKNGVDWFAANVNLDVWGEKYQLDCEAQAGQAVQGVDLPGLG